MLKKVIFPLIYKTFQALKVNLNMWSILRWLYFSRQTDFLFFQSFGSLITLITWLHPYERNPLLACWQSQLPQIKKEGPNLPHGSTSWKQMASASFKLRIGGPRVPLFFHRISSWLSTACENSTVDRSAWCSGFLCVCDFKNTTNFQTKSHKGPHAPGEHIHMPGISTRLCNRHLNHKTHVEFLIPCLPLHLLLLSNSGQKPKVILRCCLLKLLLPPTKYV